MSAPTSDSELICPACGYSLKSLTSRRCPECGKVFVVTAPRDAGKKPLMRSLGEFFGHVFKGIRTDPSKRTIRREVEEQQREDGVILRRTTIEEIELKRKQ